jgi:hypothetical protein
MTGCFFMQKGELKHGYTPGHQDQAIEGVRRINYGYGRRHHRAGRIANKLVDYN